MRGGSATSRDGEIDWSDARTEWEAIGAEIERSIENELGPDLAERVAEMRAEDEPWGRGRGQRGSGTTSDAAR